jgi:hypothetical protein
MHNKNVRRNVAALLSNVSVGHAQEINYDRPSQESIYN